MKCLENAPEELMTIRPPEVRRYSKGAVVLKVFEKETRPQIYT